MRKAGFRIRVHAHRQGITSGDVVIANSFTKCSEQIVFSSKIVLQVAQRYPGLGCHATQCKLRISAIYQNCFAAVRIAAVRCLPAL